ncbi:hypothetical protein Bpfe_011539 [Biomphalaria pfeifferi]|uniref:Uncharacterized protein n=1 Tax=Biomphalaria pfeifferi TaxID=112525 RepID=A0AAD8BSE2_BIOPF|nr:hypothetical protein Bpfe_011539 [Biomphalaria pfeifferi]
MATKQPDNLSIRHGNKATYHLMTLALDMATKQPDNLSVRHGNKATFHLITLELGIRLRIHYQALFREDYFS